MPLVLETKMADVGKLISLGNLLAWKTTWLVLTTTSVTSILSRVFGAYCMTKIVYKYSHLPTLILFPLWLPERTLSLSPFPLTEPTHPSSFYIWLPVVNRYKNVYSLQPFSSLCFFGETFSSLEHRNFVKPRKRQTTNMGEDMPSSTRCYIFIHHYLHEILSPHTFCSRQDTFNI